MVAVAHTVLEPGARIARISRVWVVWVVPLVQAFGCVGSCVDGWKCQHVSYFEMLRIECGLPFLGMVAAKAVLARPTRAYAVMIENFMVMGSLQRDEKVTERAMARVVEGCRVVCKGCNERKVKAACILFVCAESGSATVSI